MKNKEIEEMTHMVRGAVCNGKCSNCSKCCEYHTAEALYDAGYRKTFTSELASDAQKAYKDGYEKGFNSKLTGDFVSFVQKQAVKEPTMPITKVRELLKSFGEYLKGEFRSNFNYPIPEVMADKIDTVINRLVEEKKKGE